MSESEPNRSESDSSSSDKEIEAIMITESEKSIRHHHKETHGLRDDIDEKTPLNNVKAPNVFERAKEEIEALVETIHPKKHSLLDGTRVETTPSKSKLESIQDKDVKAPNIFGRVKEEIEAIAHSERSPQRHKETHGLQDDIDENSSLNDVKATNMFERAQEEIEAFVKTVHPKKESQLNGTGDKVLKAELKSHSLSENDIKPESSIEIVKEASKAGKHSEKSPPHHRHHMETHGTSDDIDENTPIDEVKGPNVFERVKEELEALVQTIHPKKESDIHVSSSKNEGGFRFFVGSGLEKACRPWSTKRN